MAWLQALHFILATPGGILLRSTLYLRLQYMHWIIQMSTGADGFLAEAGSSGMVWPQALHFAVVMWDGIFSGLIE
jgi:hypothetical protein